MGILYACGRSQTFGSRPNLDQIQQSKGLDGRENSQLSPQTGPKSLQFSLSERRAIKYFEISALRAASQQCVKKRDFPSFMTGGTCQDRRGAKSRQGKLLLEKIEQFRARFSEMATGDRFRLRSGAGLAFGARCGGQ